MKSQNKQILSALKKGQSLTPLDALRRFGCLRLASRIEQLRGDNNILTTMVSVNGKRVASYSLGGEI